MVVPITVGGGGGEGNLVLASGPLGHDPVAQRPAGDVGPLGAEQRGEHDVALGRGDHAPLVLGVRAGLGRGGEAGSDPGSVGSLAERVGDSLCGGDPAGGEHEAAARGVDDARDERGARGGALLVGAARMAAGLGAGRDQPVDAGVDRRQRSSSEATTIQTLTPARRRRLDPAGVRRVPVEDDERDVLAGADLDVVVGDGRESRRRKRGVDEVDAERPTSAGPGLVDQRLQPRRRLGGGAEDSETAGVGDRRDQRGLRVEPHPGADDRIGDAVLAREAGVRRTGGRSGRAARAAGRVDSGPIAASPATPPASRPSACRRLTREARRRRSPGAMSSATMSAGGLDRVDPGDGATGVERHRLDRADGVAGRREGGETRHLDAAAVMVDLADVVGIVCARGEHRRAQHTMR